MLVSIILETESPIIFFDLAIFISNELVRLGPNYHQNGVQYCNLPYVAVGTSHVFEQNKSSRHDWVFRCHGRLLQSGFCRKLYCTFFLISSRMF